MSVNNKDIKVTTNSPQSSWTKQAKREGAFDASNTFASEAVRSTKAASGIQSEVEKRANGFFAPQGISSFRNRGHRLSSALTTLADGCHNKRHRVNDGHQTGLILKGSSGREWRVGVSWTLVASAQSL